MRLQGGDQRAGVGLVADRREGGDDSGSPALRPGEADRGEPGAQRTAGRGVDFGATVERLAAQGGFGIGGNRHGRV